MSTATAPTRLGDGGGAATSIAIGGSTPAVASGHADGRMRLWSPDGKSLATHRAGDPVIGVMVGDKAVAVSQKYDGLTDLHGVVRLWDISTGKQIGATSTEHFQGIRGLAFGRLGGHDVLVTGDGAERIRVRRLSNGKVTHSFHTGEIGGIELLACGEVKGKPVLVSTHLDATLRVYDLVTGERRKKWTFSNQSPDDRGATALVTGQLGDVPIAVVAHSPGGAVVVRVWNLNKGKVIGVLDPEPGGAITTLALTELAGRPVVVGAGEDRLLHIWSLG
jgi:WD40 repeat protein